MTRKLLIAAIAAALLPAASGCIMFGVGPEDLRWAVSRSEGVQLKPEICLSMDGLSVAIASSLAGSPFPLHGVGWIDVGIYRVTGGESVLRSKLSEMKLKGWDSLVRVRSKTENVHVLVDTKRDRVCGMVVLVRQADQVIIARLRGDLNRLFEEALKSSGVTGIAGIVDFTGATDHRQSQSQDADSTTDDAEPGPPPCVSLDPSLPAI